MEEELGGDLSTGKSSGVLRTDAVGDVVPARVDELGGLPSVFGAVGVQEGRHEIGVDLDFRGRMGLVDESSVSRDRVRRGRVELL